MRLSIITGINLTLIVLILFQILTNLILIIGIPEILTFTGTNIVCSFGLLTGLVALPAHLRVKFYEENSKMELVFGHTFCFQKISVLMGAVLHVTSFVLALTAIGLLKSFEDDFKTLMDNYSMVPRSKLLVDDFQGILKCCGARNYMDWLNTNWMKDFPNKRAFRKRILDLALDQTAQNYNQVNSGVPFSCCSKNSSVPCVHYDIVENGVSTIYTDGCAEKIHMTTLIFLSAFSVLYGTNGLLEIVFLLMYTYKDPFSKLDTQNVEYVYLSEVDKNQQDESNWGAFSNSTAEIMPSSHREMYYHFNSS